MSMTDEDLDKVEEWLRNAKKPVMVMHPDDAQGGGQALVERLTAAGIELRPSEFLKRGEMYLMDAGHDYASYRSSLADPSLRW